MKTYLFDTINRYRRFSENLDVSVTLCNKSWWVFNDDGVKSLYIFQPNGDLYITTNGVGIKGTWQYISANKTVIINSENTVMMFHPVFIDSNILTLTLDGTQKCAFLIDENNRANFAPQSLSDLSWYFQNKEQKEIEAKRREEQRRLEERRRLEEQRKLEEQKQLQEQRKIREQSTHIEKNHSSGLEDCLILVGAVVLFSLAVIWINPLIRYIGESEWGGAVLCFGFFMLFFLPAIGLIVHEIEKGKNNNK